MALPPPLTITNPASGQPWGPGFWITGGMGIGPLPTDQTWQLSILTGPVGSENELTVPLRSRNLNFSEVAWQTDTGAFVLPGDSLYAHGQAAEVRVRLMQGSQQVIEEERVPILLDWQSGMPYLSNLNLKASATGGGGFTEADRLVMGQIQNAVLIEFAPGIISAIGGVLAGLPPNFWNEECLPGVYTGSGSLTKPAGALSTAAGGLTWHVLDWAPGIGIDEGAPDRFEIDTLQLRFVLTLANGFHYTYDHRESRELEGGWLWGIKTPTRIDYWIAPGVQVQFCWLVPTAAPYWAPDQTGSIAVPNPLGVQLGG